MKSARVNEAKESPYPDPRRWPMPVELKKASTVSTAKLVIVLGRAYRSLAGFLEGGLALQGISVADFGILESPAQRTSGGFRHCGEDRASDGSGDEIGDRSADPTRSDQAANEPQRLSGTGF
jgi:hypothetical protein